MATPTPAQFSLFMSTANIAIRQAWSMAETPYAAYTTEIPSDTETYVDGWIGRMAKMREWLGGRVVHTPGPQTYSVTTQLWENTYGIDRFTFAFEKFGVYYGMIQDLPLQAKRQPGFVIRDMLENTGSQTGARQNGLDGLANFATNHPVNIYRTGAGTYSNDFRGGFSVGGVTVGGALGLTSFGTAIEYMHSYKAEDGERLNVTPNMMIIPLNLQVEAEIILKNQSNAPSTWGTFGGAQTAVGAQDNVYKRFGVDYMVEPNLLHATNWYLADTTKSVKPVRWIKNGGPVFSPRVSETDENMWVNHMMLWGCHLIGTSAWSPSWLMAKSGP